MPKLPVLRARHVIKAFTNAGAVYVSRRGSHMKYHMPDGHIVIIVDHGGSDYPIGTLRRNIEQSGLSEAAFLAYLTG